MSSQKIQQLVANNRLIDLVTAFKQAANLKFSLVLQDKPDTKRVAELVASISAMAGKDKAELYTMLRTKVTNPDSNPFDVLSMRGQSTNVTITSTMTSSVVNFNDGQELKCSGGSVVSGEKKIVDNNEALFCRAVASTAHVVNGEVKPHYTQPMLQAQPDSGITLLSIPANSHATLTHGEYKNACLKYYRSLALPDQLNFLKIIVDNTAPCFTQAPPVEMERDEDGTPTGAVSYFSNAISSCYSPDQKAIHEITIKYASNMHSEGVRALALDTYFGVPLGKNKELEHLVNMRKFHGRDMTTVIETKDPILVRFLQENVSGKVFGITEGPTDTLFMNIGEIYDNNNINYIYHPDVLPAVSKNFKECATELEREWTKIRTIERKYGKNKKHVWCIPLSTLTSMPVKSGLAFDAMPVSGLRYKLTRDYSKDPKDYIDFDTKKDFKAESDHVDKYGLMLPDQNVLDGATMYRAYLRAKVTPTSATNCSVLWCEDFTPRPLLNVLDNLMDYMIHIFYGIYFPAATFLGDFSFNFLTNLKDMGTDVYVNSTISRKAVDKMWTAAKDGFDKPAASAPGMRLNQNARRSAVSEGGQESSKSAPDQHHEGSKNPRDQRNYKSGRGRGGRQGRTFVERKSKQKPDEESPPPPLEVEKKVKTTFGGGDDVSPPIPPRIEEEEDSDDNDLI